MGIEKYLEEPVAVDINDSVAKVVSKMISESKREVIVEEEGKYTGMLYARSIAKRNIFNPEKTKILHYIRKINPLLPGMDIDEVLNYILINDLRAVPVKAYEGEKETVKLITRTGLLKAFKASPVFKEKKAGEVMVVPYFIEPKESVSVAKAMFRDLNISSLPVIENGRVVGMVDELTLMETTIKPQEREFWGEKISSGEIAVESFMRKDVRTVNENSSLREVVEIMTKEDHPTVMVESEGKVIGMITRKDILKVLGEEIQGVYIRISGIQEEDEFIKSIVNEEIKRFIDKVGKMFPLNQLVIHIDKYKKSGEKMKYSVKARLITQKGVFFADDHEWDLTKVVQNVLEILRREVIKRKEKAKGI